MRMLRSVGAPSGIAPSCALSSDTCRILARSGQPRPDELCDAMRWTHTISATGHDVYVALGDSYTSGPLIPGPKGEPAGCGRSDSMTQPQLVAVMRGIQQRSRTQSSWSAT